jgi:hypothetical protein
MIRKINIFDYLRLGPGEKADMLWRKGIFVQDHYEANCITNLYYLEGFFVEVVIDNDLSQITEIAAFISSGRLEKYLDSISIDKLLGNAGNNF